MFGATNIFESNFDAIYDIYVQTDFSCHASGKVFTTLNISLKQEKKQIYQHLF